MPVETPDIVAQPYRKNAVTRQGPALVVLAAGVSSRYGASKQLEAIGPGGEMLADYAVYDARRSGFARAIFVIRPEDEVPFADRLARLRAFMPVDTVHQRLDDLPREFATSATRNKPWGTGHALLAAEKQVDGPFALINADDFYGASAFAMVRTHLTAVGPTPQPTCGLVGFRLGDTLATPGAVSRGLCRCGPDGFLEEIREARDIRSQDGRMLGLVDGAEVCLDGNETVSMNFWAFFPVIFPLLRSEFLEFLEAGGGDGDTEFLLTEAVNRIVASDRAGFKMLPARTPSFGVTSPEDKPHVQKRIRDLIDAEEYPVNLFTQPN